jgi:lysozyme family protein
MTPDFSFCLAFVLRWEGGYVDHPDDPGGETNFGISKRAHPTVDIKALTWDLAADIYKRHYWEAARCDELPPAVALVVFDSAVNQGVKQAIRFLQRALGVTADGVLGPATLAAIQGPRREELVRDICVERQLHYASLKTWPTFGRGWTKRLLACLAEACYLLGG